MKNISKEIIDKVNLIEGIISFEDEVPTANDTDITPFDDDIPIVIDKDFPIETITTEDDIDIPSDDGTVIDEPKKIKIITTNANQMCIASEKVKKNTTVKNLEAYQNMQIKKLLTGSEMHDT